MQPQERAAERIIYVGPEVAPPLSLALLRQRLRVWWQHRLQRAITYATRKAGIATFTGELRARQWVSHLDEEAEAIAAAELLDQGRSPAWIARFLDWHKENEGKWVDYGVVGVRSVTDAGVAFMVDDFDAGGTEITNFNFHESGTGIVAENVADTLLGTPVETRDAGTRSQPAANQYRSVATHTYGAAFAITEHGFFDTTVFNTVTLWDRTVFGAINVVNTDQIEFTYTLTVNSGG